jgi:hypothetical protein
MKLSIILFILCTSFKTFPVNEKSIIKKNHIQFVLKEYIPWINDKLKFNFNTLGKGEAELIKKAISKVDNWKTPEHQGMDQVLYGVNIEEDKKEIYFRIYLHRDLRNDLSLKRFNLKNEPLFIEKDQHNIICFLSKASKKDVAKMSFIKTTIDFAFFHECQNKMNFYSAFTSQEKTINSQKKEKFKRIEHIFFDKDGIFKKIVQDKSELPIVGSKTNNPFFLQHHKKTLLELDKYSIDKQNNVMLYVP